jgi:hypothetical protein
MRNPHILVFFFVLIILISGCTPPGAVEPALETIPVAEPTPTFFLPVTPTPDTLPTDLITLPQDLTTEPGPLLLLQTDFHEYMYLNPLTQALYPFEYPIADSQFRFRSNLSPSGTRVFFPLENSTGLIIDLFSAEVIQTYDFSGPALFNQERAAIEAEPWVSELDLTPAGLLEAVTQAHQSSRQLISWFQSDRYHITVQDSAETSTSLFLYDHQTGLRIQLEDLPGLVENFSVGSDGNTILLKKGLVFMPGAYRDNHYYLLNVNDQTTLPLPLPEDVQNPSVTWFDQDTIGIIHQAYMSGGSGFSLMEINSRIPTQIITGEFFDLRHFGDHLFYIQRAMEPESTTFNLITQDGQRVASRQVDKRCFYQYAAANWIVVQCELESFLLDQDLIMEPFFDFLLTLSPSPDRSTYVMNNRSEQSFLLDTGLQVIDELLLEETPLEILWLPDSTGFLYRTHGKLYFHDLFSKASSLLIKSDLFSDYSNLNAVWIKLE